LSLDVTVSVLSATERRVRTATVAASISLTVLPVLVSPSVVRSLGSSQSAGSAAATGRVPARTVEGRARSLAAAAFVLSGSS
jgi:hypothetical protein